MKLILHLLFYFTLLIENSWCSPYFNLLWLLKHHGTEAYNDYSYYSKTTRQILIHTFIHLLLFPINFNVISRTQKYKSPQFHNNAMYSFSPIWKYIEFL